MTNNNLKDKKVVITRPQERSEVLANIIREDGAIPIVVPTLELQLVKSPELLDIVDNINTFDWIIFTSVAGVKSFFEVYGKNEIPCKIAVIGIKTEEIIKSYDNTVDLLPDDYTAEGLLESFKDIDLAGKKVALPRTLSARKVLPEGLSDYGADVYVAEAYTSAVPKDKDKIINLSKQIINNGIDVITFTSPLTVKNLFDVIKDNNISDYDKVLNNLKNNIIVCSIGPITGAMLKNYGLNAIEPDVYTVKDMINTLKDKI